MNYYIPTTIAVLMFWALFSQWQLYRERKEHRSLLREYKHFQVAVGGKIDSVRALRGLMKTPANNPQPEPELVEPPGASLIQH